MDTRKTTIEALRAVINRLRYPLEVMLTCVRWDVAYPCGANTAAIDSYNAEHEADIEMRQCKSLNNVVEQDHRAIKRVVRPMLGFKSMRCAKILLAGIETMHMIRKGQLDSTKGQVASAANQFYALAF